MNTVRSNIMLDDNLESRIHEKKGSLSFESEAPTKIVYDRKLLVNMIPVRKNLASD